ncbi:hypothetical protein JTB14_020923 [Gonioctena quinquepunctata]|nr:hypothetical protein JTB14_020923 [Gonioctena quinquepunctata]
MAATGKTCDLSSVQKVCGKCKIVTQRGLKCIKCETVIHNGCVKYLRNINVIDSDCILCCDNLNNVPESETELIFFDALERVALEQDRTTCILLHQQTERYHN